MIIDKPASDRIDVRIVLQTGDGDTIASVGTVTIPAGLTLDSQTVTADTLTLWLLGGTEGTVYDCSAVINTAIGRISTVRFRVRVVQ